MHGHLPRVPSDGNPSGAPHIAERVGRRHRGELRTDKESARSVFTKLAPDRFELWNKALDRSASRNSAVKRLAPLKSSLKSAICSIMDHNVGS